MAEIAGGVSTERLKGRSARNPRTVGLAIEAHRDSGLRHLTGVGYEKVISSQLRG